MATDRKAEVVWQGDLVGGAGRIESVDQWGDRAARRLLGSALRGAERQDEP